MATCGTVDIYWFSGTGNTLLVARRMAEVFQAAGATVTLKRMEKANPETVRPPVGDGLLGLAFPVAAFSTYPLVWRFVERLPAGGGARVFMVDTLGGFSGLLVGPLRRLLESKGYVPVGARQILMPSNYLGRAKPAAECAGKTQQGLAKAEQYAREILAGRAHWRRLSPLPYGWVRRIWQLVERRMMIPDGRAFKVSCDRCTRCRLCVELCPVRNISLGAGPADLPVFGGVCQQCQRCIACCPAHAIYSAGGRANGRYRAVEARAFLTD